MKHLLRRPLLLLLLGIALVSLPACGSKNTVKSENPPETVLNPENTPTAEEGVPSNRPAGSYVEKIKKASPKTYAALNSQTPQAATPSVTTQSTPNNTPSMETAVPVQKKGGSSWIWWVLLILALGGAGWYFWSKNQAEADSSRPKPPTGGLSPVSGFTAVKDRIENDTEETQSIWTKKLF